MCSVNSLATCIMIFDASVSYMLKNMSSEVVSAQSLSFGESDF